MIGGNDAFLVVASISTTYSCFFAASFSMCYFSLACKKSHMFIAKLFYMNVISPECGNVVSNDILQVSEPIQDWGSTFLSVVEARHIQIVS